MSVDPAWVLALMLKAEPDADRSPWRASYGALAAAIAEASDASPLFAGADGAPKTAALLVSVAWFESRFRPDAEGDKDARGVARSLCALQVGASNLRALGTTRDEVLRDVRACVRAGLRMMHASFAVCRRVPLEHRLDHYAVGGPSCTAPPRDEGAHRVRKALWLFRALPPR